MKTPVPFKILPDDSQAVKDGWQVHQQRDFRGGETQALLPEIVGRNQLLKMENVLLFTTGYLSAFFQLDTQVIGNASPGMCLHLVSGGIYNTYYASGDNTLRIGSFDSSSSAVADVLAGTSNALNGAYISGLSHAVSFLGKLYCCNPNPDTSKNGILDLTDKTLITIAGKTAIKLRAYTNRLWIVNSDGTIQISDNGDATTWNALNITWLPNQEPALDFIPVQGGAIVYGASSVYAMYGSSYQDITFSELESGKRFTSGNVVINGTVYILSTEGIYAVTLNGAKLLPHNQQDYFQSIFSVLAVYPSIIQGIHLQRFNSIMFSWNISAGGTQSLIYYYGNNSYAKANVLLPASFPYLLPLNDINSDFLFPIGEGQLSKSLYPSNNLKYPKKAVLQTRHEDADSARLKEWAEFGIFVHYNVFGVTIEAFVDYSDISIIIASNVILAAGDNIFNLNNASGLLSGVNFPSSKTISFRLTFDNQQVVTTILTNETSGNQLVSETTGNYLAFDSMPGNFMIQSMRLKYCLTGPDI